MHVVVRQKPTEHCKEAILRLKINFKKSSESSNSLTACSASFPSAQTASFLISTLNSSQRVLNVSSCSSSGLNPCRGRWQVPVSSLQGSGTVINSTTGWVAIHDHYGPGKYSLLLLLPTSRVTRLPALFSYETTRHHFIRGQLWKKQQFCEPGETQITKPAVFVRS